jgi:hypothetical protein
MIRVRTVFWVTLGAVAGVLVAREVGKAARAYTPEGIGRSVTSVAEGLRELAEAVREGMDEREAELRLALGVDADELERG